jgi:hypothetical protein
LAPDWAIFDVWAIFNLALYLGFILQRKGRILKLTKYGVGCILGDFWRPLGDFLQKHLVTLSLSDTGRLA